MYKIDIRDVPKSCKNIMKVTVLVLKELRIYRIRRPTREHIILSRDDPHEYMPEFLKRVKMLTIKYFGTSLTHKRYVFAYFFE